MKTVYLAVQDSLNVPTISCAALKADTVRSPGPYLPLLPPLWEVPLAAVPAGNLAYDAALTALQAAWDVAEAAADAANEAFEAEEAAEQAKGKIALGVLATSVAAGIAGFSAGAATAPKEAE